MRKWMNSNNRAVTDGPFSTQIFQGCTFDHKRKFHTGNEALTLLLQHTIKHAVIKIIIIIKRRQLCKA